MDNAEIVYINGIVGVNSMEELINKIHQGHAIDVLKEFPDKFINMVMTSPPYWALRDYGEGTERIWDADENCEHNFEIIERQLHSGTLDLTKTVHHALKVGALKTDWKTKDGFCNKCGAWKGQLGLEPTFDLYIKHLCDIFDEVKRVLRDDGTIWVNIGDSYNSHGETGKKDKHKYGGFSKVEHLHAGGVKNYPSKCLCQVPFRFAIEMVNRGWILRNTIIWHKRNCMPSSVKDRFTIDFEYIFFFSKKKKYYFEQQFEPYSEESIKDFLGRKKRGVLRWGTGKTSKNWGTNLDADKKGRSRNEFYSNPQGRNKRATWTINPQPFPDAHFAVFPPELCETPIKAGCPEKGIVLDPFAGSGTACLVAKQMGRRYVGIDINEKYVKMAKKRLAKNPVITDWI